jgi:hypothetical protein
MMLKMCLIYFSEGNINPNNIFKIQGEENFFQGNMELALLSAFFLAQTGLFSVSLDKSERNDAKKLSHIMFDRYYQPE